MASHRRQVTKNPELTGWKATAPKHSQAYRISHRLGTWIAVVVSVLIVLPSTIAAAIWVDFDASVQNSKVDVIPQKSSSTPTLVDPNKGQPIDILIIGQDSREGSGNESIGGSNDPGLHNADTTMVMQVSADRSYINLVSIPRDSLVDVPSCQTTKGTIPAQYSVMFNSVFANAWQEGGDLSSAASCTMAAVNSLTGMSIQNFIVVDFAGLRDMIDAIGGVSICIPVDTKDSYTSLNLSKGLHHLNGTQATQYARMRHGTGTDGSDIMRTTRQQYLVKELIKQAMAKNLFTQTSQLYQLAKAALGSLNISSGLASTTVLASLAMSLKNLDTSRLFMMTTPVEAAPSDPNRVVWSSAADAIWTKMRNHKPLTEQKESSTTKSPSSSSSSSSPSATSTQTVDPTTGLITDAQGQLIDPNTNGIVDPETGTIRDASTGQYIGIADRYLNATICAVPAQD